jgi:hypothetical protein
MGPVVAGVVFITRVIEEEVGDELVAGCCIHPATTQNLSEAA